MIRSIDIKLNAAHPELPLVEATTFVGAPSSVFIRGVPKAVGNWSITAVSVAVTYPDNTTTARAAVESAEGVWVATIPGTATSGRTAAGFKIVADGIDENGAAVTGYVLGFADFSVLSFTPVPAPGGTFYLLRYFDQAPATPKEGDAAKIDGVLKFYNGSAWEPFAAPPTLDDAVTRTSANGVKSSGIWSAIWGAATTTFSSVYDWIVSKLSEYRDKLDLNVYGYGNPTVSFADGFSVSYGEGGTEQKYTAPSGGETITFIGPVPSSSEFTPNYKFYYPSTLGTLDSFDPDNYSVWCLMCPNGGTTPSYMMYGTGPYYYIGSFNSVTPTLALGMGEATGDAPTMARPLGATGDTLAKVSQLAGKVPTSRTVNGKALSSDVTLTGADIAVSDTDATKINAALAGKQAALTTQQLANIAAVPNKADVSAIPYSLGTPTVIDEASSETVEGETVNYGAATLANRTANIVQVTAATPLDELRITFPAATSGKVRDFGLRVEIGTGSAALTAPSLVPIAPTGETIKLENADGTIPELADGTATAKGVTLLYFSETAPGVFVVKGEQVEEVA